MDGCRHPFILRLAQDEPCMEVPLLTKTSTYHPRVACLSSSLPDLCVGAPVSDHPREAPERVANQQGPLPGPQAALSHLASGNAPIPLSDPDKAQTSSSTCLQPMDTGTIVPFPPNCMTCYHCSGPSEQLRPSFTIFPFTEQLCCAKCYKKLVTNLHLTMLTIL